MTTPPYFFLSYPRASGAKVEVFKKDLEEKLMGRVSFPPRGYLVTFDRDIQQGKDWVNYLTTGLKTDNVLLAVLDARYFSRDSDCGKELKAFISRHKGLRVDGQGCLVGLTNILLILWQKEEAIRGMIPPILRRIEDVPAISKIKKAVARYTDKGMESCVKRGRVYYEDLIDAFADAIRQMPDLDPGPPLAFAELENAFDYDWSKLPAEGSNVPLPDHGDPRGPGAVAAFYMMPHFLPASGGLAPFAGAFVIEVTFGTPSLASDAGAALLRTVHAAAVLEGREAFHYGLLPSALDAESITTSLAALQPRNVLTMLVVDPDVWPGKLGNLGSATVDTVVLSKEWLGPVILPDLPGSPAPSAAQCDEISKRIGRRVLNLGGDETSMIDKLRPVLVSERGRVCQAARLGTSASERPPALQGVRKDDA